MSHLFKQIQRVKIEEQMFTEPLKIPFKRERRFNMVPCLCIVSLLFCFVIAYFYFDRNSHISSSFLKELPVKSKMKSQVKSVQQDIPKVADTKTDAKENLDGTQYEEVFKLAENAPENNGEIVMHPVQWNIRPLKNWVQEHLKNLLPEIHKIKEHLNRFAYFDVTQPIPEKEISPVEKERLELIHRFLKKFNIEAVRIDGAYSRVMANGQNYYVNTVVSQHPRLKLSGITVQEMIFKDEYNQEYRKKISQND